MSCRIITLAEEPEFVGRGVCAIGVFDGVHAGHAALVRDAVVLAKSIGVGAYIITFDRDPDQVVTPASAAPQLLTLEDKATYLCDEGADAVLVVPFTQRVAAYTPSEFFFDVLLSAVNPMAIIVGEDFRFGHRAQGTVETLTVLAKPRGIDVVPYALVTAGGEPVTSTRIRSLVAAGDVEAAAELLGRPHRVAGTVVRGRGEGASIGVPTANIDPVVYAAMPADGVYAGRAIAGGQTWPAAISVGRAPTFENATDQLEVHLIGFEGDLYDTRITVQFLARLRDQRRFDSVPELLEAVRDDIATAGRIATGAATADAAEAIVDAADWDENPITGVIGDFFDAITLGAAEGEPDMLEDGTPVVEDAEALEEAERAVADLESKDVYAEFDETWVEVLGPVSLVNVTARLRAFEITSPLTAEGIPFVWDPMPPEELTTVRPELVSAQRFHLYVPREHASRARELVAWWEGRGEGEV